MNALSILLTLAALLLAGASRAGAQTITARSNYIFRAISFPSPTVGYAAGADSVIKTIDAGRTWVTLPFGAGRALTTIRFIDERTGWVAGDTGTLFKTTDGGASWVHQHAGVTTNFRDIRFISPQTGFLVGTGRTLLRTTDGGASWSPSIPADIEDLNSISFPTPDVGYVAGQFLLYRTSDGGASWTKVDSTELYWSLDIHFLSPEIGLNRSVGFASYIERTTDGGRHWQPLDLYNVLIDFLRPGLGYGAAHSFSNIFGTLLRTTDMGITWDSVALAGTADSINGQAFLVASDSVAFLAGFHDLGDGVSFEGRILRLELPTVTAGVERGETADGTLRVAQIPGADAIAIRSDAAAEGPVEIIVSDLLGRTVARRSVAALQAGVPVTIALPEISAGVYIVELSGGTLRAARKIVLR